MSAGILFLIGLMTSVFIRHERWLEERKQPFTVPWDPSWPSLPVVTIAGALRDDLAQLVYAVAGTNTEVLQYIPCYCGCRSQGHQSNLQCYIKRRAADGRVIEWDGHARICPMGNDITGDAVFWHQHGDSLASIRAEIDREYSSRGPATPTPPVPGH